MTTPAVDIYAPLFIPGYYELYDRDGRLLASGPYGTSMLKLRERKRPASTSQPRNPITGWRSPGSWYSYGSNCNPCPVGTLIITQIGGNNYHFSDGAGWDYTHDDPIPDIPDALRDRVVGKALSKLKNQKVNLALAALERAETAEMVVNTIHRITDLTRAFKDKDPGTFFRRQLGYDGRGPSGRKIPEAFLEWQYGVRPLMTDVHGACDALLERDKQRNPVVTIKASGRQLDTIDWFKSSGFTGTCGFEVRTQRNQQMKLRLDYELTNAIAATLASVGITNPLELAWERLPFSFVADWFIPVGNWLGYLDADLGYRLKSGSWTEFTRQNSVGFFSFLGPAGNVESASWNGGNYSFQGFKMKRGLYGSTPLPSIGFKNPFPKNGVHIANAAALLAAVFSGGKR